MDLKLTASVGGEEATFVHESCKFLSEYWWLLHFKWTDIFLNGILDKVPENWHEYLSQLSVLKLKRLLVTMDVSLEGSCPSSFHTFLTRCRDSSPRLRWSQYSTPIPPNKQVKRTSVKKLWESITFGQFIADYWFTAQNNNKSEDVGRIVVVDIGCGLGYLSRQLHQRGFLVKGVDAKTELCESANSKMGGRGGGEEGISFHPHHVSDSQETLDFIEGLVPDGYLGILVSLHGCGDLLDHVLNLFVRSNKFKGLFCVTCCYHKISKDKFPRSDFLTRASQLKFDPINLRVACQKTPLSWTVGLTEESLEVHTKSAAFRGILEEVQVATNYAWKKTRSRMKQTNELDNFIDQAIVGFPPELRGQCLELLKEVTEKRSNSLDKVRTLKILQTLIQPVMESVVVFDHVIKLREHGFKSNAAQVFSQVVSPRNTAVIALK